MIKQMTWLSQAKGEEKILYLRLERGPWRPYTMFPQLTIPDSMAIGSRGFATFQKLLREGWEIVASDQANQRQMISGSEAA